MSGSLNLVFDPEGVSGISQRLHTHKLDLVLSLGRGQTVANTGASGDSSLDQAIADFRDGWRDGSQSLENHFDNIKAMLDTAVIDFVAFDEAIGARFSP